MHGKGRLQKLNQDKYEGDFFEGERPVCVCVCVCVCVRVCVKEAKEGCKDEIKRRARDVCVPSRRVRDMCVCPHVCWYLNS